MPDLRRQLNHYAKGLGFDLVKVTTAHALDETKLELESRLSAGIYSPWAVGSPRERTTPTLLLPGAQSVIMVAMAYSVDPVYQQQPHQDDPVGDDRHRAELSRYAWGQDYHRVMIPRLQNLAAFLETAIPGAETLVMVDSGPLAEKALAYRAGLGFFGWNSCIITEELGSWVFLGTLLTTLALEPDPFRPRICQECGRCMQACPTGAIVAPYVVNPELCLSQVTQMRGSIPLEFRKPLGARLFGCDTCQAVCPHNDPAAIGYGNHGEFQPHPLIGTAPLLEMVVSLTNRNFRNTFGQTAAGWRGKKVLQRNALINLGNTGDPAVIPLLAKALEDPTEPVRASAIWSLGNIGRIHGEDVKRTVREILTKAQSRETASSLHQEILAALDI